MAARRVAAGTAPAAVIATTRAFGAASPTQPVLTFVPRRGSLRDMRLGVAAALVGGSIVPGDVEIADGAITAVALGDGSRGQGLAAPGFVDLQVNGFAGVDLMRADAGGYATAGAALAATGVTAYRPTLITAAEEELAGALSAVAEAGRRGRAADPRHPPGGPVPAPGPARRPPARAPPRPRPRAAGAAPRRRPRRPRHARARAPRRAGPDRRAARPRDRRRRGPLRRDRRAGARRVRRRDPHRHPPLQRDATAHRAGARPRPRRARARGGHRAAHRRRPPRRRRHAARRLGRGARPRRPGHRRHGRRRGGRRRLHASAAGPCTRPAAWSATRAAGSPAAR